MKHFPIITDVYGVSEPLYDWKGLKRVREVNGERSLSFSVLNTDRNQHVYDLVKEESIVEYKGIEYRIKFLNEKSLGSQTVKHVVANHRMSDLLDHYIYDVVTGVKSIDELLTLILAGTPYTFTVMGTFASVEFKEFGNDNALSLLNVILSTFQVEYEIDGTFFTFKEQIGNATDFQFRYKYNTKVIDVHTNTTNLSTYIKGYGKDIEAEYVSPNDKANGGPFERKHARPVRDEKFTSQASLIEHLKKVIIDEPEFSVTLDFADLRAAGYPYDVPNDGDNVFVIHEPMKLDLETRIMRIDEDEDRQGNIIKCKVTLANFKKNASDLLDAGDTQKKVNELFEGSTKLPFAALDTAVQKATQDLQSAQTEVEFNNGFILRNKDNPNFLVLLNSSGIGVSEDGGQTFKTAVTGRGFVADLITVGTMLADRIKGGTLVLGGTTNGRMQVLNANGEIIADLDAERRGFSDLYVANLESPTVVSKADMGTTNFYVAEKADSGAGVGIPDDSNDGLSWASPLRTIAEALRRIPKYFDGTVQIFIAYGQKLYEQVLVQGFTGGGQIIIDGQDKSTTIVGSFVAHQNQVGVQFKNAALNSQNSYSAISYSNTSGHLIGVIVNGLANNGTSFGVDVLHRATLQVQDCEVYSVQRCINGRYGATAMVINCVGYGSINGLYTYGGFITGGGTAPAGGSANVASVYGQPVAVTFSHNSGSYTPPAPPETTSSWDAQSTDSWHEGAGVWDSTTNDPLQGKWGSAGRYRGCWFFGSAPSTAVTGKTIKQIRVYLQRAGNSGNGATQTAVIRPHGYTTKPAGAPGDLAASHSVGFKWGEAKWVTLPFSFHSLFANGSAKGIMIYTTDDSQYMRFMQAAKIEITYA